MAFLAQLVELFFYILNLLIFARILMSWLPMMNIHIDRYNPAVQFLIQSTDIFLEPFRQLIPPVSGMDFSPIIAILAIQWVGNFIVSLLYSL